MDAGILRNEGADPQVGTFVFEAAGQDIQDELIWSLNMPATRLKLLEPGYIPVLQQIIIDRIPDDWPDNAKRLVKDVIKTMDPRRSLSAQKFYKDHVHAPMAAQQRPNIIAVLACRCATLAYNTVLLGKLRRFLEPDNMDFLLDLTRVVFDDSGEHVADWDLEEVGRETWFNLEPFVLRSTTGRDRRNPLREERLPPVYIMLSEPYHYPAHFLVAQPDITRFVAKASDTDYLACEDKIVVSWDGRVLGGREAYGTAHEPEYDDRGRLIGPPSITTHPFFQEHGYMDHMFGMEGMRDEPEPEPDSEDSEVSEEEEEEENLGMEPGRLGSEAREVQEEEDYQDIEENYQDIEEDEDQQYQEVKEEVDKGYQVMEEYEGQDYQEMEEDEEQNYREISEVEEEDHQDIVGDEEQDYQEMREEQEEDDRDMEDNHETRYQRIARELDDLEERQRDEMAAMQERHAAEIQALRDRLNHYR
ncbi:hypothetical protein V8F20_001524 [Naviculisporaceae sp. PSN 640]